MALLFIFRTSYAGHHHAHGIFIRCPSVHDTADLAAAEHQNPVGKLQEHIQVLTDENDGGSFFLLLIDEVVDRMGRVDIQTTDCIG